MGQDGVDWADVGQADVGCADAPAGMGGDGISSRCLPLAQHWGPLLSPRAIRPCHEHPGCLLSPACGQHCHMCQLPPARQAGLGPSQGGGARAGGLHSATGCSGQSGDTSPGRRAGRAQGVVPGGCWCPQAEPFFGEYDVFGGVTMDCPMPPPSPYSIPRDEAHRGCRQPLPSGIFPPTVAILMCKKCKHQLTPGAVLVLPAELLLVALSLSLSLLPPVNGVRIPTR